MRPDRFFLRREDRLRDSQIISKIFRREGKGIHAWPLSLFYLELSKEMKPVPAQSMVVIPRKKIKRQVQRQRLKRQIREMYRLQKPELFKNIGPDKHFALVWFYAAKEPVERQVLHQSFTQLTHDFIKRIK